MVNQNLRFKTLLPFLASPDTICRSAATSTRCNSVCLDPAALMQKLQPARKDDIEESVFKSTPSTEIIERSGVVT